MTVILLQSFIVPWFQQRNNAAQRSPSWHQQYSITPATTSESECQLWPWTHLKSRIWTNVMRQGHCQGGVTLVSLSQHLRSLSWDVDGSSFPLGFIHPRVVVWKEWRYTVCAPDRLRLHFTGPLSRISQVRIALFIYLFLFIRTVNVAWF